MSFPSDIWRDATRLNLAASFNSFAPPRKTRDRRGFTI